MKKPGRIITAILSIATLWLFATCGNLLAPHVAPPAAGGDLPAGMGRVVISIAGAEETADSRTLFPVIPAWGNDYDYKLEFIRQGKTEPALTLTIAGTTLEQDIDPGDYTLTVTACDAGTSNVVAVGSELLTVVAEQVTSVTVLLALKGSLSGSLAYAVTLPAEMTLTEGSLTLYSLSGSVAPIRVDLGSARSGVTAIPSGYYRAQLAIYGSISGAGKFAAKTGALHIYDSVTTTASYTLDAGDFTAIGLYVAGNNSELETALTAIRAAQETEFTVLASGNFALPPVSLADPGYSGKTITLRGLGGIREISLASQGSLFTVGSASSEPALILRDITLRGKADNNAPLLRIDKGELLMESGALITGNTASISSTSGSAYSYGGGVYVAVGGSFIMSGGEISGNTAFSSYSAGESSGYSSSYGGGVYNEGTFAMSGGKIADNTVSSFTTSMYTSPASSYGGGVYNGGTFAMSGGEIVDNTAHASSSIYSGQPCSSYGNGVYVAADGSFAMSGGKIAGNTASISNAASNSSSSGGGVYVATGGSFIMSGGEIVDNTLDNPKNYSSGGGVSVATGGSFAMSGGKIADNTANASDSVSGGGVFNRGTFVMSGGKIAGNTVNAYNYASGGGVHSGGTFTMSDGEIADNTASDGGGVYVSYGTLNMSGGKVSGNTASSGGGVYAGDAGTFTMSGGTISGNTASSYGGGVYNVSWSTITKSGGGIIYGSNETGTDSDGNDLKNTAQTGGDAAYYALSSVRYRNTTVGTGQNLSTGSNDNWTD
jgi:hypothetical protein